MKNSKSKKNLMSDSRGFSLIEVLLGISVFMIGMLGVTALNISSMKSTAFSGNLSEATLIGASKIEELMAQDFDDPASLLFDPDGDGTGQDEDDDGLDDDNPDDTDVGVAHDDDTNFGLDDFGADADYNDTVVKNNMTYNIYWNVARSEPMSQGPERTRRITVIVEWFVKDEPRRISMTTVRQKEAL